MANYIIVYKGEEGNNITVSIAGGDVYENNAAYIKEHKLTGAVIVDSDTLESPSIDNYSFVNGKLVLDQTKVLSAAKKECKEEAKFRLVKVDWAALPDVPLANKEEFETYRATLRDLIINPVENPVYPEEPKAVWL